MLLWVSLLMCLQRKLKHYQIAVLPVNLVVGKSQFFPFKSSGMMSNHLCRMLTLETSQVLKKLVGGGWGWGWGKVQEMLLKTAFELDVQV